MTTRRFTSFERDDAMKQTDQSRLHAFAAREPQPVSAAAVARFLSLVLAAAMILALVLFPTIVTHDDALLPRAVLPVLLIGIAGGVAHGLGYRPRSSLLAAMLGPWVSWPLMASAMAFLVLSAGG